MPPSFDLHEQKSPDSPRYPAFVHLDRGGIRAVGSKIGGWPEYRAQGDW